jgi:hypothetical protein
MSAELLRQAATILRKRAEGATPGPWFLDAAGATGVYTEARVSETSQDVALPVIHPGGLDGTDRYIATMHPGVGLALAGVLDLTAKEHEGDGPEGCWECDRCTTLARLIVGDA